MNKIIVFILILVMVSVLFVYLYFYSPMFRHYYNLIFDKNEIYETYILQKGLNNAKDLNGEYKINIKIPELYAVGIEKRPRKNIKGFDWPENLPVNVSVRMINKNNKIIVYSKIISDSIIMSLDKYGVIKYVFDHIPLKPGEYTMEVKLLDGSFLDLENTDGVLFFYMKPTGFI